MSEFKPCPFCGSVNLRIAGGPVYVECNDCAAYGPSAGYENKVTLLEMRAKAIALWEKASEKTDRANAELASLRGELAKVTQQRDAAETRSENIARQAICLEAQRDTLRAELEAVKVARCADDPAAWTHVGTITDRDGAPIGTDEREFHWGKEPPEEYGWAPLYLGCPKSMDGFAVVPAELNQEIASSMRKAYRAAVGGSGVCGQTTASVFQNQWAPEIAAYAEALRIGKLYHECESASTTKLAVELDELKRRIDSAPAAYARAWNMDFYDELNGPAGTWKLAGEHRPNIVGHRVALVRIDGEKA